MKITTLLRKTFTKTAKAAVGLSALAIFAISSPMSASADAPQFNSAPTGELPTFQVAAPGQAWGNHITAQQGDVVNFLIWDHNSILHSVAHNVRLKIDLGSGTATVFHPTGTVSADNAASVRGVVEVDATKPSALTYVQGSATYYTTKVDANGNLVKLVAQQSFPTGVNGDDITTNGINLGDQQGCWTYAQAVQIQVRIEGGSAQINTNKRVMLDNGQADFGTTATARPGDIIDYKIFLQNTGTATGLAPQITDALDPRFTYIPNSSFIVIKRNNADYRVNLLDSRSVFDGNKITWAFEDMAPTPSSALYLMFQVKVADTTKFPADSTNLQNCAVSSFVGLSTPTNCVTVTILNQHIHTVSFSIVKEVRKDQTQMWYDQRLGSAAPGDILNYRITVQDTGTDDAQNVTIKDLLPAGIIYKGGLTVNGVPVADNSIVNNGYTIASMTHGSTGSKEIIFNAEVTGNCNLPSLLSNWAEVYYQGKLQARDNADVIFSCTKGLIIQKDVKVENGTYVNDAGNVTAGQVLTYRITVLNNGNATITNPILHDVIPAGITYISNSLTIDDEVQPITDQNAFLGQGFILTDLAPGLGKTVVFKASVNACLTSNLSIVNTAYASGDQVPTVSDTAKATELACSVKPTPTPPTTTPTPPIQLPHTGPEAELGLVGLMGLSGAGYGTRWYLLKKRLHNRLRNLDIL